MIMFKRLAYLAAVVLPVLALSVSWNRYVTYFFSA
jgi:hypothetical protein